MPCLPLSKRLCGACLEVRLSSSSADADHDDGDAAVAGDDAAEGDAPASC